MKFARYWTRARTQAETPFGEAFEVTALGWSDASLEEAARRASEGAQRVAARIAADERPTHGYGYADRPVREEIVEEIKGADGEMVAAVTRNSYGSLVLNTKDLMFIDVDLPEASEAQGLVGALKGLFGSKPEDPAARLQKQIASVANSHGELTVRLYRTLAGFRCVITNRRFAPESPESQRLLEEFGADPLYVKLCQVQQSFRARLTPKFWRCGGSRPPNRFPWDGESDERAYRVWEREYEARCTQFATCRFVEQFGTQRGDEESAALIRLHDRMTKADLGLEMA